MGKSCALFALVIISTAITIASAADIPTHGKTKEVKVKGEGGGKLRTIAPTLDGNIAALVGLEPVYNDVPGKPAQTAVAAEVHILDADGAEIRKWKLDFAGQSIGVGPDGSIYVGGDGHVAKFDPTGKLINKLQIPHIAEVLKDNAKIREMAEAQMKSQVESYEGMAKSFADQIKILRDKAESRLTDEEKKKLEAAAKAEIVDEKAETELVVNGRKVVTMRAPKPGRADHKLTADEKEQLQELEATQSQYTFSLEHIKQQKIEDVMSRLTARLRIINSVSITEKDFFMVCGEMKGYGYSVWRMDPDLKNPVNVLSKLGGCCGQMDVQASGNRLVVAENTKHRVGQYDRTGKPTGNFGKAGRDESVADSFGGCCNPMNCRLCANGDVYTSESEGIIKKFSAKGEFLGLVAAVKLEGGCKNVAVAASPSGDKVYLCDQPGSKIVILQQRSPEEIKAAAEQRKKAASMSGLDSILKFLLQ